MPLTFVKFNYWKKMSKYLYVPPGDRPPTTSGTRTTVCTARLYTFALNRLQPGISLTLMSVCLSVCGATAQLGSRPPRF